MHAKFEDPVAVINNEEESVYNIEQFIDVNQ